MKRKKDDLRRLEDETTKMENVKYEVSQEIGLNRKTNDKKTNSTKTK